MASYGPTSKLDSCFTLARRAHQAEQAPSELELGAVSLAVTASRLLVTLVDEATSNSQLLPRMPEGSSDATRGLIERCEVPRALRQPFPPIAGLASDLQQKITLGCTRPQADPVPVPESRHSIGKARARMRGLLQTRGVAGRLQRRQHDHASAQGAQRLSLTGAKTWITHSPIADVFVVCAKDDEGPIRGFMLDKSANGLTGLDDCQRDGECRQGRNGHQIGQVDASAVSLLKC
jgi:hypothetical protein